MLLKQSNKATTTPQAKQQGKTKSHRTKKQIGNWSDLREYFDKHTFKRFQVKMEYYNYLLEVYCCKLMKRLHFKLSLLNASIL